VIGKKLAHYEISAKIGEGGMGEVYRARDSKLDRDIALKILPRELSGDRERAARFEREARTLASLQHANVASIYDYEEADGVRFLAMELVEGEDLAERLERGAVSVDEALTIALQIATGLEAAHERGIMHRDLKPANVKIAPDGLVKILDFGLARAWSGDPGEDADPMLSPTITAAMTQAGTILGTAAYMSPEQARGRTVDKRSDIWAFGVMLYEMLTGKRLYDGETVTDILGAIVHSRPDLELLPPNVPSRVRDLLERCLTAELPERLRDIGEARIILSDPGRAESMKTASASAGRGWMVATGIFAALAIAFGFAWWTREAPPRPIVRAAFQIPEGHAMVSTGLRGGAPRVSPDGKSIVFLAKQEGRQQIWVRTLEEREARPVPGTDGAHRPFWSPDGRSIGFFANGQLRRIAMSGGAPLTIAPAANGRGAVWLDSGLIIFAPMPTSALFAVPAAGGQPRQITDPGSTAHREPRWLPLEGRFLFLDNVGGGQWEMCVGSVDGGPITRLGRSGGGVEYADGHLLFLQGRTLVAQPFDLERLQLTGEPAPIAEHLIRDPNFGIGTFSVAPGGTLCYQAGLMSGGQLVWFGRDGAEIGAQGRRAEYTEVAISPDGSTLATVINDAEGKSDIWLVEIETDARRRFTFSADDAPSRRGELVWGPDGSYLLYSTQTDSGTTINVKQIDGSSGEETVVRTTDENYWPYDVSSDGQWVVLGHQMDDGKEDLFITPVAGGGEMRPLFQTPYDEWPGTISPNQRWLAVDSDETGLREIYVVPFPEGAGRWQVSRDTGRFPKWSAAGDEIFFLSLGGSFMAAPVEPDGDVFEASEPVALFEFQGAYDGPGSFDVNPEGDKFILVEQSSQSSPISLFLNWNKALEVR
jgi:Tol biopolymer transport system component/tRNA A-37 threonylcarbamoyl transferase component Bud32